MTMMKRMILGIALIVPTVVAVGATGSSHSAAHVYDNPPDTNSTNATAFSSSWINVQIPFALHHPDGLEHKMSDFGVSTHGHGHDHGLGGSISAFVYFVDGPLCDPINFHSANASAMPKIYPTPKQNVDGSVLFESPFILLTRSGYCSPVTKVRHAQSMGAAAVIIGHDDCRCWDTDCVKKFPTPACINTTITVPDDGSSGDITVPSFLLFRIPSEAVMGMLKNKKRTVLMELTWGLQETVPEDTPTTPVVFRLWSTAYDPILDHDTLQELKTINQAFTAEQVLFTPHYAIVDGTRFGCESSSNDTTGPCDHLCTNNGRYCTSHARDLSGFAILTETIRRICIWKHYASPTTTKEGPLHTDYFWDYVIFHRTHCSAPNMFANETCIQQAYEAAKIPIDHGTPTNLNIDACMANEGNVTTDAVNPLLEYEMMVQKEIGIVQVPALKLDKYALPTVSATNLFLTICDHYMSLKPTPTNFPAVCDTCSVCPNVIGCLEHGSCVAFAPHNSSSSHSNTEPSHGATGKKKRKGHGWFWTFLVLILIGGGTYYYYTHYGAGLTLSRGTSDRAGLLNNYFQLGGEE